MAVVKVGMSTHGLGDSAHFVQYADLWRRRGHDVRVASGGYSWLYRAAGYTLIDHAHVHPWYEPNPPVRVAEMWCGSKVGRNLMYPAPLPRIGHVRDLWPEVLAVRIDLSHAVSQGTQDKVAKLLDGLPNPTVALHTRGHTNGVSKDFPPGLEQQTIDALAAAGCGVVVLDRDGRGPRVDHPHVRRATGFDLEMLYAVIDAADVFVGIDAGPYHLARMTSTPRVGCWWGIAPWHACLPLDSDSNLIGPHALNAIRGDHFHIKEVPVIDAEAITAAVTKSCQTSPLS